MSERPFRFGIPLAHEATPEQLVEEARTAEGLGYSTLQAFDQLALVPSSPVPALAYAAAVTTTIGLSAYVFDNGYRHPVMLAKEAAVLDRLCGGRLELGIGAGYSEDEYRGSGIAFPSGAARVRRLEEAVAIVTSLFRDGTATHAGQSYRVDGFTLPVAPIQRPWPRLMIGGARRALLSLAAREADIVSLAVTDWHENASIDATRQKLEWIREAAGTRGPTLELETLVNVRLGRGREEVIADRVAQTGRAPDWYRSSPHWVGGSAEEIAETLRERRRDLGISYISVRPREAMREFAQVIRLLS